MITLRVRALAIASVCLVLAATGASACHCSSSSDKEHFSKADLVVKGRMKTVTYGIDVPGAQSNETVRATRGEFEIEAVLKGSFTEKTVSIYTGAGRGDCGRLEEFIAIAFHYHDKLGVVELGLMKGKVAGQIYYVTSICDYAKYPQGNSE